MLDRECRRCEGLGYMYDRGVPEQCNECGGYGETPIDTTESWDASVPMDTMVWYCNSCGNITPKHPETTLKDIGECTCGKRAWSAITLETANQKRKLLWQDAS